MTVDTNKTLGALVHNTGHVPHMFRTITVSYTHLDVYKRQEEEFSLSGITITFNRTAECNRTPPLKNTGNYFLINGKRKIAKQG